MNSFSYSSAFFKGSVEGFEIWKMKGGWQSHCEDLDNGSPSRNIKPSAILNPNKAILTIDQYGKVIALKLLFYNQNLLFFIFY